MDDVASARPEDEALASVLEALANAARLTLLREIRSPRILKEIRLASVDDPSGDRPISRQAVSKHLAKLIEAGLVDAHESEREFGVAQAYIVNHQRLFGLAEQLRDIALLRPLEEPVAHPTIERSTWTVPRDEYPRLLLVRGLNEGRVFPLDAKRGSWTIGRGRGTDVRLDYDIFASAENTILRFEDGRFVLEDLPAGRNGTYLNFARLERGAATPLAHGDVIGVGRSLLLFQSKAREPERGA